MDTHSHRARLLGVSALLAVGLLACTPRGPRPTGAHPEFVRGSLEGFEDGSFKKGRLRGVTELDGFSSEGWVHRYADGSVRYLRLAAPATVAGHAVPRGTAVFFADTGAVQTLALSKDTRIDGHLCRGGRQIHTGLHPSGRLRVFFSRDDTTVDGVPCRGSVFHPIRLHENGRLAECRVAARTTIDGVEVRSGTTVRLDETGALLGDE